MVDGQGEQGRSGVAGGRSLDRDEARGAKAELTRFVRELLERRVAPRAAATGAAGAGLALGLAPRRDGGFGVAVRYHLGVPTSRMLARRVSEHAGPVVDVRRTGRIRPLAGRSPAPRPPVVTALAVGETGRARPLRPGVSVAHTAVSAGTLGAFVRVGGADGPRHLLSNHHVLVGDAGREGDRVLQPGPADGGQDPRDRVATLSALVPLAAGGTFAVDAALALLDDGIDVDPRYPIGAVTTTAGVVGSETVEKIGRTTGVTRGRVTAIEMDDVVVDYGGDL